MDAMPDPQQACACWLAGPEVVGDSAIGVSGAEV